MWCRRFTSALKRSYASKRRVKHENFGPPIAATPVSSGKTMLEHIYKVQQQFPNSVVLAQVGSFMELYFDQAVKYGPLLNLKVATKSQTSPVADQDTVYMSGFPLSQKEKYERILVRDMGLKVVTLMQDSRAVINGDPEEVKRPVARILTPGTLLGESYVDESVSNFLASVSVSSRSASLMWVDVAQGDVHYMDMKHEDLGNALARVGPSEVLLDASLQSEYSQFVVDMVGQYSPNASISQVKVPTLGHWRSDKAHKITFKIDSLSKTAQRAFVGLSDYISTSLPANPIELQPPTKVVGGTTMELDASARSSLDLTPSTTRQRDKTGATNNNLFSAIKRTQTSSGSRLLHEWISAPLLDVELIKERQDKVQYFLDQNQADVQQLRRLFLELPDCPRVLQKLHAKNLDPRDLVAYANSIVTISKIHAFLETNFQNAPKLFLGPLVTLLPNIKAYATQILSSIKLEVLNASDTTTASNESTSVLGITPSASDSSDFTEQQLSQLKTTHSKTSNSRTRSSARKSPSASNLSKASPASHREYVPVLQESAFHELSEAYRKREGFAAREYSIYSRLVQEYGSAVELRWSPLHDHHIKTTSGKNTQDPAAELVLARSKNTIYFHDLEWKKLGTEMLQCSAELKHIEGRILDELRTTVIENHIYETRQLYKTCDQLDVILSFAQLAREHHLVRPDIVDDPGVFDIKGGRHLTMEIGLPTLGANSSGFVPNDCILSTPQPVCMITGPNMGGKSTFLRQNALIALLAQTGCYVPCDEATIGIIDRIYCRIGAGDDLYRGRSTFMVEMLEAAEILNTATERSLAIVDEVGRGTSNNDGVAIAYAAIKHLALRTKCRVLFATHYGTEIKRLLELETQGGLIDVIRLLMADLCVNPDGKLIFQYQLKEGIASSSRGLLIAKLAGFPEVALQDAIDIAKKHTYV